MSTSAMSSIVSKRKLASNMLTGVFAALICALLVPSVWADSQARIVRLSDVQGSVQIDKNSGLGFENAFLNLPITQGTQIRTRGNGRAEVEFEDGSTLRLTPNTLVEFSTLGLNDGGARLSVVTITDGLAYVNWFGKKGDQLALNFAEEKIALDRVPAHFRVDSSSDHSQVAVFSGDVEVETPSGKTAIEKKKMATFDAAGDKPELANLESTVFDDWDKQAASYHDQYAKNNSTPYGYGYSDLNYYGSFQNVAGYGLLWQPYFAGAGWDPFMDGAWAWYPGFGSMFVSAYPWGWMPYRYGSWMFLSGFGWMWQPGAWNAGFATAPRVSGTLPAGFRAPVAPTGTVNTVAVGRGGAVLSGGGERFRVNSGSAGIGIARGSLPDLKGLNHQVAKAGFAEIHPAPQFSSSSPQRGFGGAPSSSGAGSTSRGMASGSAGGSGGLHSGGGVATAGHH